MKSKLASIVYDSRKPTECIVCRDSRVNVYCNLTRSTMERLEKAMNSYDVTVWIVSRGTRIFISNERGI